MPDKPIPPPPPAEPGDALDVWLAEWLMGWHKKFLEGDCNRMRWFWCRLDGQAVHLVDKWRPSSSTALALDEVAEAAVKRLRRRWEVLIGDRWHCARLCGGPASITHKSLPAAVCLAAAQALYAELSK